jgi:hypothetical protein
VSRLTLKFICFSCSFFQIVAVIDVLCAPFAPAENHCVLNAIDVRLGFIETGVACSSAPGIAALAGLVAAIIGRSGHLLS